MKNYRNLVTITLLVTALLVLVGGATRVFEAGVSCPDWPHCYGLWWPWPEARVALLNGLGYVVEGTHYAWWQVLLEWSHRLLAGVVSLLVIGLLVAGYRTRGPLHHQLHGPLTALLSCFLLQILLGGVTVRLANIHWSVAIHLGMAMLVLASLLWLRRAVVWTEQPSRPLPAGPAVYLAAGAFAVLALVTMLVGAMVSSSHAGAVCGGLVLCLGHAPETTAQHWHMAHRGLALTTALASVLPLVLLGQASRHAAEDTTRQSLRLARARYKNIHLLVWPQVALGIATLYSFSFYPGFYPLLSLAHLAWGTLVWLAAVSGLLTLTLGPAGRAHQG